MTSLSGLPAGLLQRSVSGQERGGEEGGTRSGGKDTNNIINNLSRTEFLPCGTGIVGRADMAGNAAAGRGRFVC